MTSPFLHNPHLEGAPFHFEGSGPDGILLFHGLTATPWEVYRLGKVLNRLGYTTVGPTLPGHATQPSDMNRVSWKDWIATGESAYQELAGRCKRVYIGGESTGALVALYLANRHPEISAILTYSPALRLHLKWWQRIQAELFGLFGIILPKGDMQGNTTWQGYKAYPVRGAVQLMRLQKQVDRILPRIRQPLLVVAARNDKTINAQSAQIVYGRVGSSIKQLHWMEKSGHCVLLEEEQGEVMRLTMDFLFKVKAGV